METPFQIKVGKRRLLVVENHPVTIKGICTVVNTEPDLEACGVVEDQSAASEKILALNPDLVLLELILKQQGRLSFLSELIVRHPSLLVLILSMHEETLYAPRALRAGARGYVMKLEAPPVRFAAIRKVLSGGIFLSARMERKLLHRLPETKTQMGSADLLDRLSDRELEVFRLIGEGKTTCAIAAQLCRSPKTIETHRIRIKEKLDLQSTSELLRHAVEMHTEMSAQVK